MSCSTSKSFASEAAQWRLSASRISFSSMLLLPFLVTPWRTGTHPPKTVMWREACLRLRPEKAQFMLGAKDIGVEAVDPLPPARGHVQVADGALNVRRHAVPIELRIFVDQVRRRFVAELPVQADFLEFIEERIGLSQIVRIAELTDEISGPQQRGPFVDVCDIGRRRVRESRVFDRP